MKSIWLLLALIAGTFLPVQAGLNARVGKAMESPVHASAISFFVGTIAMAVYIILTRQSVNWAGFKSLAFYDYFAGALGAFYVTVMVLAFPRIGPALSFGLVVAGQMIISLILDHFNILVSHQHSINVWRLAGIALIITGVVLVRRF